MELSQVRVVLVRPRGPTNVGVAARAIANHGLGELVLVAPQCFDPEEARWRGPGARSVIDGMRIVSTVTQAVAGARLVVGATARRRRWDWPVWNANMLADAVIDQHGPAALVFGPEDAGLSNDELEPCTAVLTLRTGVVSSLNLAQAVTVTGHALYSRQAARRADPLPSPRPATADVIHAVMTQASTVLALGGYLRGRSKQQVRSTLVRMLGRLAPTQTEAAILGGMVRHVRWTLTHPDHPDAVALRAAHSAPPAQDSDPPLRAEDPQ